MLAFASLYASRRDRRAQRRSFWRVVEKEEVERLQPHASRMFCRGGPGSADCRKLRRDHRPGKTSSVEWRDLAVAHCNADARRLHPFPDELYRGSFSWQVDRKHDATGFRAFDLCSYCCSRKHLQPLPVSKYRIDRRLWRDHGFGRLRYGRSLL